MQLTNMFDMNMYFLAIVWIVLMVSSPKATVVAFLLNGETTARCPLKTATTYAHGDYCYEFVLGSETYWHDAKRACEHQGGYLATVDTPDVQSYIMSVLNALKFNHHGIWIGLNDEAQEQHWKWADGTPLGNFRYWASGQGNQILHNLEDCVHLRFADGGHWHDSLCDSLSFKYNYICQFHLLPTQATTHTTITTPQPTTTTTTVSSTSLTTTTTLQPTTTTLSSTFLTTTPQPTTTTTTVSSTSLTTTTAPTTPTTTTTVVFVTSSTDSTTSTPMPTTTTTVQITPSPSTTTTTLPTTPEATTKAITTQSGLETLPPCESLVCGLDCGVLGFVYGNDGCPTCACAT